MRLMQLMQFMPSLSLSLKPVFLGLALLFVLSLSGCETLQTPSEPVVTPIQKAPVQPNKPALSQVARLDTRSGFGGTGHSSPLDSGFGGTGRSSSGFGGTGVVGTIRDFGSIWVNGIEVGLGQQTQVLSNLPSAANASLTAADLYVGQQVWFETLPDERVTVSKQIHIFYPIAGPIEAIVAQGDKTLLTVAKQSVWVDKNTRFSMANGLQVGDYVRVSALPILAKNAAQSRAFKPMAWQATLLELNPQKITLYQAEPALQFSANTKRLVLQTPWLHLQDTQKSVLQKIGQALPKSEGVDAELHNPLNPSLNGLKPIRSINSERAIEQGHQRP